MAGVNIASLRDSIAVVAGRPPPFRRSHSAATTIHLTQRDQHDATTDQRRAKKDAVLVFPAKSPPPKC